MSRNSDNLNFPPGNVLNQLFKALAVRFPKIGGSHKFLNIERFCRIRNIPFDMGAFTFALRVLSTGILAIKQGSAFVEFRGGQRTTAELTEFRSWRRIEHLVLCCVGCGFSGSANPLRGHVASFSFNLLQPP